jgi:hypothetical protein
MTASHTIRSKKPASFTRPACTVGQVYPKLLRGLCALLDFALEGKLDSDCWYGTFFRWFRQDLALWESERTTVHHLRAFGGMGSFNDLVPTVDFPGGRAGFERFHRAYRLLKELSYASAQLWYEARRRYPDQGDRDVLIDYRGVPVTICTCAEGHRWMKENFAMSYYASHAATIAEMNAGFDMVAELGGKPMVDWLFRHKLAFDLTPVLDAMRAAVARLGLNPKPENCNACRKKQIDGELLYLIGWPMALSPEFFRVELAAL